MSKKIVLMGESLAKGLKKLDERLTLRLANADARNTEEEAYFAYQLDAANDGVSVKKDDTVNKAAVDIQLFTDKGNRIEAAMQIDDATAEANFEALSDMVSAISDMDVANEAKIASFFAAGDLKADEVRDHFGAEGSISVDMSLTAPVGFSYGAEVQGLIDAAAAAYQTYSDEFGGENHAANVAAYQAANAALVAVAGYNYNYFRDY